MLYEALVHEDGYVRSFYKKIKELTKDGAISRTFITGVTPIMLDDVTSGANIFTITSNDKDLNSMLGITEEEVNELINNIVQKREYPEKLIDENVKTDYGRLRNIAENFVTDGEMLQMLEQGEVGPVEIKERFSLESLYKGADKETNIKCFLFIIGWW